MYIFITCDQYVLYRETVSYMYILSENKNNARCLFNKFSYLFFLTYPEDNSRKSEEVTKGRKIRSESR